MTGNSVSVKDLPEGAEVCGERQSVQGALKAWLRRQPKVRWMAAEYRLRRKYGFRLPDHVVLPNSGAPMFLDRTEQRARQLLLGDATGQGLLKNIWHLAISRLQPCVVVDVGANYGEFLFGERYPADCRVIGIEANAALEQWLRRSREHHPDRDRIIVETAIAAESSGESRSFFLSTYSSGRSSAIERNDGGWKRQDCTTVAVDDLAADVDVADRSVVFKIDVEGYESQVLAGMRNLVSRARTVLGIIEFNSAFIEEAGCCPAEFLQDLAGTFRIAALARRRPPVLLDNPSLDVLRQVTGSSGDDVELDLVLLSDADQFALVMEGFSG